MVDELNKDDEERNAHTPLLKTSPQTAEREKTIAQM